MVWHGVRGVSVWVSRLSAEVAAFFLGGAGMLPNVMLGWRLFYDDNTKHLDKKSLYNCYMMAV